MSDPAIKKQSPPQVSVIIPFLNNWDEVRAVINVIRQNHRDLNPEIICVDNGSDNRSDVSEEFRDNTILTHEHDFTNSPYSARNRGIQKASGRVIVFVDANSYPGEQWLENGIRCLTDTGADIVAGHVGFDFNGKPNAAKVADALTSIHQKKSVVERQSAYTANLFVNRTVFESIGLFEEGVRSGGDVRWTNKAVTAGFKMVYCTDAVVLKKARPFWALVKKRIRTGKGYLYTWLNEETGNVWFYNFLRSLKPPALDTPDKLYYERYRESLPAGKYAVWVTLYFMSIVEQVSFMTEYLRYNLGNARNENRQKKMDFKDKKQ